MKTGLRRHLTPGNAVAMAALMVALGGTGVAASTLANGSVTSSKIANSAVTSAKIAPGTLDASDFQPNVLGGVSAAKVTVITGTPVNVPALSAGTSATATCPAGQRAISGGFNVGSFASVDATGPTADGLGWSVTAETGGVAASIFATVVCVAP
jgi:hypothetical protein